MEWTFLLTTDNQPRVQSRILRILDHHQVTIQSIASFQVGDGLRVSFAVHAEPEKARRIEMLVRKLQDIRTVEAFPADTGLTRTIALFKIMCDQLTRLTVLQVVAALEVRVLTVQSMWIVVEAIGTGNEIETLERILCPYGLVQSISAASVGVHGFESHPREDLSSREAQEPKNVTEFSAVLSGSKKWGTSVAPAKVLCTGQVS